MTPPATPYLLLDLDVFDRNVERLVQAIVRDGGKQWRPHVKAIRSPALALRLLEAGASGVTCSNVEDAAHMVAAGIGDVLIATQVTGEVRQEALVALNRRARVRCTTDSLHHARSLGRVAAAAGVVLPVLLEVDVGLARAGVAPGSAAVEMLRSLQSVHGLRCDGLMAWEGHTTRIADPRAKEAAIREAVGRLTETAAQCRAAGLAVAIVSCGGTGTYTVTSRIEGVTELEAGGGVFGDLRYRNEFHMPLEMALTLRTAVISRPTSRRIVCDAGWKVTGYYPTPSEPVGVPAFERLSYSAEHLTIELVAEDDTIAPGSELSLAVGYSDATVFLHRRLYAGRGGRILEVFDLPDHA